MRGLLPLVIVTAAMGCNAILGNEDRSLVNADGGTSAPSKDGGGNQTKPDGGTSIENPTDSGSTADVDSPANDSGVDANVDCKGQIDCPRIVFVTSTTSMGAINNLAGANAICNQRAQASTLQKVKDRTFAAYLSTNADFAQNRLVKGTKPYLRLDDAIVVDNFSGFLSGALKNGINRDENNQVVSGPVWTGTNASGSGSNDHCNVWQDQTNGFRGQKGQAGAADGKWTDDSYQDCNQSARLYCLEQ